MGLKEELAKIEKDKKALVEGIKKQELKEKEIFEQEEKDIHYAFAKLTANIDDVVTSVKNRLISKKDIKGIDELKEALNIIEKYIPPSAAKARKIRSINVKDRIRQYIIDNYTEGDRVTSKQIAEKLGLDGMTVGNNLKKLDDLIIRDIKRRDFVVKSIINQENVGKYGLEIIAKQGYTTSEHVQKTMGAPVGQMKRIGRLLAKAMKDNENIINKFIAGYGNFYYESGKRPKYLVPSEEVIEFINNNAKELEGKLQIHSHSVLTHFEGKFDLRQIRQMTRTIYDYRDKRHGEQEGQERFIIKKEYASKIRQQKNSNIKTKNGVTKIKL